MGRFESRQRTIQLLAAPNSVTAANFQFPVCGERHQGGSRRMFLVQEGCCATGIDDDGGTAGAGSILDCIWRSPCGEAAASVRVHARHTLHPVSAEPIVLSCPSLQARRGRSCRVGCGVACRTVISQSCFLLLLAGAASLPVIAPAAASDH